MNVHNFILYRCVSKLNHNPKLAVILGLILILMQIHVYYIPACQNLLPCPACQNLLTPISWKFSNFNRYSGQFYFFFFPGSFYFSLLFFFFFPGCFFPFRCFFFFSLCFLAHSHPWHAPQFHRREKVFFARGVHVDSTVCAAVQ